MVCFFAFLNVLKTKHLIWTNEARPVDDTLPPQDVSGKVGRCGLRLFYFILRFLFFNSFY